MALNMIALCYLPILLIDSEKSTPPWSEVGFVAPLCELTLFHNGNTRLHAFARILTVLYGYLQNGGMQKWNSMSDGQAAVELFWRLNHARQTVDFVRRQIGAFSKLDKATMNPMEALTLLNGLREYESALLDECTPSPPPPPKNSIAVPFLPISGIIKLTSISSMAHI